MTLFIYLPQVLNEICWSPRQIKWFFSFSAALLWLASETKEDFFLLVSLFLFNIETKLFYLDILDLARFPLYLCELLLTFIAKAHLSLLPEIIQLMTF